MHLTQVFQMGHILPWVQNVPKVPIQILSWYVGVHIHTRGHGVTLSKVDSPLEGEVEHLANLEPIFVVVALLLRDRILDVLAGDTKDLDVLVLEVDLVPFLGAFPAFSEIRGNYYVPAFILRTKT